MELHIIIFLIPYRNLWLSSMFLFNFSVTSKTDYTPQKFHNEACSPVFQVLFYFFLHFLWNINSLLEHSAPIQTILLKISWTLFENHPALLFSWLFPIGLHSFSELLKSSTLKYWLLLFVPSWIAVWYVWFFSPSFCWKKKSHSLVSWNWNKPCFKILCVKNLSEQIPGILSCSYHIFDSFSIE